MANIPGDAIKYEAVQRIRAAQELIFDVGNTLVPKDSGLTRYEVIEDGYIFVYAINGSTDDPNRDYFIEPSGIDNATVEVGNSTFNIGSLAEAWDEINLHGDVKPGTDSVYDLGTAALRWTNGYFDNLFYSGALNNSHQVENNKLLPVAENYRQGVVLCMTKDGVKPSEKNNSNAVVGVFESKQKSVCTFGVYKVLVSGKVRKGDRLITAKHGKAKRARFWERNSFAIALEDKEENYDRILAFIKP